MLIDSHCHLDRIDLKPYDNDFNNFMLDAKAKKIEHLLCISIDLATYPKMLNLVENHHNISVTVGAHPNAQEGVNPTLDELITLANNDKVIGIGETGLDYFRSEGDLEWQRQRFRDHIKVAKILNKPLIIHTREAKTDTLKILREETAEQVGGIIHCFTEDWNFAKAAMDLNFYISFSGIVTFNNTDVIKEVAKKMPANRILIETDSPYLAPIPFRGKPNYPLYVQYVAEQLATLRGVSFEEISESTTNNFYELFNLNS